MCFRSQLQSDFLSRFLPVYLLVDSVRSLTLRFVVRNSMAISLGLSDSSPLRE